MRRVIASLTATLLLLSVLAPSVVMARSGAVTPFKYASPDVTCLGARVVDKVGVKDIETCLNTNAPWTTAGTYHGNPMGLTPWGATAVWKSDYDGASSKSWTITAVDLRKGTFIIFIVASY